MPPVMLGLGFVITGNLAWLPVLMVGEMLAATGVPAFAANIFKNLK